MKGESEIRFILETAEEIIVPSVVLGELYSGFQMGKQLKRNTHELELFLANPGVFCMDITKSVAERYGLVIKILQDNGTPIPTNDIWIASLVLETGAKLLTRDSHFEHVPGIAIYSF
jgi:tRNA(fMet)-specific endonuclease VapC